MTLCSIRCADRHVIDEPSEIHFKRVFYHLQLGALFTGRLSSDLSQGALAIKTLHHTPRDLVKVELMLGVSADGDDLTIKSFEHWSKRDGLPYDGVLYRPCAGTHRLRHGPPEE